MMETGSLLSLMSLAVLVAGIAIGLVVGRSTSPAVAEAARLRGELDRTLREHETYKSSVNSHFRKTADLVGQMTKSYAAVYDHLASGARRFCPDGEAGNQVPFGPLPGALSSPVIDGSAEEVGDAPPPAAAANENGQAGEGTAEVPVEPVASADAAGGEAEDAGAWPTDVAIDDAADLEQEVASSAATEPDAVAASKPSPAGPAA